MDNEKREIIEEIVNREETEKLQNSIDIIKGIGFEAWYKGSCDMSEGVWLGNGIGNQFTLKVTTNSRVLRQEVEPGFGYVIKKGKAALMKLMSDE